MFEVAKHWNDLYNKNALSTPPPAPAPTSAPPPPPPACNPEALMAMAAGNPYPVPYPVFGLIPGFHQPGHPAGGAPLHMYVSPQAAAVQQVVAAAVTNAQATMGMQPTVTTAQAVQAAAAARFNFAAAAGQQLYHFAAPPGNYSYKIIIIFRFV